MKTVIFKNNAYSYRMTLVMGMLSGCVMVLFYQLTRADYTALFPVFLFACTLIALFSERNLTAGLHTAVYVISALSVAVVKELFNQMRSGSGLTSLLSESTIFGLLICVLIPQAFLLYGFVMYYGRMQNILGWILRLLPAAVVLQDEISCIRLVMTYHYKVYTSICQGVLLIGYVGFIIAAAVLERKKALRGFST